MNTAAHAPHTAPAHLAGLSLVNLAARQRMLSQRLILQTLLAAQGRDGLLAAAVQSLTVFRESQQHLLATAAHLEPAAARQLQATYHGAGGVAAVVQDFIDRLQAVHDLIAAQSPRVDSALGSLVALTDPVLQALNAATSAFDQVTRAQSEAIMKELVGIVNDIQTVSREAKVVSFNAQVVAARAGQHGREFAVVANVLTDITGEIDTLSRKAAELAERSKHAA